MTQPLTVLRETFGYDSFRHDQAGIIEALIAGKDAFVLMPTGGGKSLCYQIPALLRDGVAIVVSPLIALMHDQVGALQQYGIRAAFLNSTLAYNDQQSVIQAAMNNELDLLYVAPERLLNDNMLASLEQIPLALFAIDEAHCVSQWGHDFRREYQQLSILSERFPGVPRIALTATADRKTRNEIISQLSLHHAGVFVSSFDRPNIRYLIEEASSNARDKLWRFLEQNHPEDAGIVYCLSRKKVETVAEWLSNRGRVALPYHAGMSAELRARHQQRFLREDGIIIVATIAFGMGIDKPDVRFVAHLSLPKNIESYYQETGRAGRDGQPASAWMSYGLQDVISLRQMIESSDGEDFFKRITLQKLQSLLGLCELTTCRRQALLAYFDESLAEPCGNCDNCLKPPETVDATTAVQKALSCVYRTGQRFGVNYLIDVLHGKEHERIRYNGHDRISTYGIGTELTAVDWRSLFRQLIARGFLLVDHDYGSLRLSDTARGLLRGEQTFMARKRQQPEKAARKEKKSKTTVRSVDQPLRETLRELRLQLAEQQDIPPYMIFHDATLDEMARHRPATDEAFLQLSGVGQFKLDKYGEQFMKVIRDMPLPEAFQNTLSDTANESLALFLEHGSVEKTALARDLKETTVLSHLATAIGEGVLALEKVIQLEDEQFKEIQGTAEMLGMNQQSPLKPLYEELEEAYDYGTLRCVVAALGGAQ